MPTALTRAVIPTDVLSETRHSRRVRSVAIVAVVGIAVYVLLPHVAHAGTAITALHHANLPWIAAVGAATICAQVAGSAGLIAAAPVPLALRRTFAVQLAAASANRVTPAGLGGMATNIVYLRRAGATKAQAIATIALISATGFVVHTVSLAVASVLGVGRASWSFPPADIADDWPVLVAVPVVLAAAGGWMWAARLHRRLRPVIDEIAATARRMEPRRIGMLFVASSGVTASYAAAFAASAHAYGASASVATLAVVFLGASAVAAAAPTPGGLGALDAALVAGLAAAGTRSAAAVAAVLTYRTIAYWLPVVPGLIAGRALRHRHIL